MSALKDLTGKRFGRLTVVGRAPDYHLPSDPWAIRTVWICQCDCGTTKNIMGANLTGGYTKSCGCLRSERARDRALAGVLKKNSRTEGEK